LSAKELHELNRRIETLVEEYRREPCRDAVEVLTQWHALPLRRNSSGDQTTMKRPIARLVCSAGSSNLGTGMTMLAVPWFVLEITGRGTDTGLVVMAEAVGLLLGSAFGGPWVDRLRPRAASVAFDVAGAVLVAAVPLLHSNGLLPLWLLGLLALGLGLTRAPGDSARHVLIPDIAQRTATPTGRVITAYDAPAQGARALGAPIAGVVIASLGAPTALVIDAASFLLSALIIRCTVDEPATGSPSGGGYLRKLVEGLAFLRRDRTLFAMLAMIGVTNGLNGGFFTVLVPIYGKEVLHSAVAIRLISAASGAAMIVGSVLFSWIGLGWRRWPVLVVCYLLVYLPRMGVFLLHANMFVLIAVSAASMLAFGPLNPIIGAVENERTPPELRARVFSAVAAASFVGLPIGTALAGVLADGIGLLPTVAVFAGLATLMSLCPLVFPAWRQVERVGHADAPRSSQRV
jgi:predicted MFS family arabinose efflux permease